MIYQVAVMVIALLLVGSTAQEQSIEQYQQATRTVLNNARHMIEPTLSQKDRDIAQSIDYRVTGSFGIGAFAAYEDGRRVIVIHAGTVPILEWFFDAIFMDEVLGHRGCFEEYRTYLGDRISDNTRRVNNHLPPTAVANALQYSVDVGGACHGVTIDEFTQHADYRPSKARALEASIVFLYLHELGHHVHGDTEGKLAGDRAGLKMSRGQEDAADQYAVLTALRAGYYVSAAFPWFSFMASFGGDSVETEVKSDHPLGIRRVLAVYERTLGYLKANPDKWPDRTSYQEAIANLDRQVNDVRGTLEHLQ